MEPERRRAAVDGRDRGGGHAARSEDVGARAADRRGAAGPVGARRRAGGGRDARLGHRDRQPPASECRSPRRPSCEHLRGLLAADLAGFGSAPPSPAPIRSPVDGHTVSGGRALPVHLRDDARARPPRADVRAPRPRRRADGGGGDRRAARPARAPPRAARPVGELAVLAGARHRAWRPPARRSSACSRAPGCRGRSPPTPTTSRRSTCWCAATRSRSRPSCGGTRGSSPGWERSRCGSWTPRRARATPPRSPRSCSASSGWRRRRASPARADRRPGRRLDENRFLASRDGVRAELIDVQAGLPPAVRRHPRRAAGRVRAARARPRLRGGLAGVRAIAD